MRNLLVLMAVAGSLAAGTASVPANGKTQMQNGYAAKGVQIPGAVFDQGAKGRVQQFNRELGLNFPGGYSEQGPVLEFHIRAEIDKMLKASAPAATAPKPQH